MELLQRLYRLEEEKPKDENRLKSYLPYRSKAIRSKSGLFDYQLVGGKVLSAFLGKSIKPRYKLDVFRKNCSKEVASRLTDEEVLSHVEKMYFEGNAFLDVSPEFLLLHSPSKGTASSDQLGVILSSFLEGQHSNGTLKTTANFLEKLFLKELWAHLENAPALANEEPYLPFLAKLFAHDLRFLTGNSDYMLSQFENFLELYNFLYCTQLALNIRPSGEPSSKDLYFILDTEKASMERALVRDLGYQNLDMSSGCLFPILSLLEHLNGLDSHARRQPLWKFAMAIEGANAIEQDRVRRALQRFGRLYVEGKFQKQYEQYRSEMVKHLESNDAIEVLKGLVKCAIGQFDPGKCTTDKRNIFEAYTKSLDRHVGRHFVQSRGRAGRVLVINQDFLMLLTNLAIGKKSRVGFQDLLQAFRDRGVYFDKQSQQTLIDFFERVGNVERMSDSGDAVYVRSTI